MDDGLYLWNLSTEEWTNLLENYFSIVEYKDMYFLLNMINIIDYFYFAMTSKREWGN